MVTRGRTSTRHPPPFMLTRDGVPGAAGSPGTIVIPPATAAGLALAAADATLGLELRALGRAGERVHVLAVAVGAISRGGVEPAGAWRPRCEPQESATGSGAAGTSGASL